MDRQDEREQQLRLLDDEIGRRLRESEAAGELRAAPSWGRPLADDGYFDAPPELRLAFKVLKNAGAAPAEVDLMRELQQWREQLAGLEPGPQAQALRERIAQRELEVALRIERLARTLTL